MSRSPAPCDPLDTKLASLELSVRTRNCLKNAGIYDGVIRDLLSYTERRFLTVQNFGRKSLNELADACREKVPDFSFTPAIDNQTLTDFFDSTLFDYPNNRDVARNIIAAWERFKRLGNRV